MGLLTALMVLESLKLQITWRGSMFARGFPSSLVVWPIFKKLSSDNKLVDYNKGLNELLLSIHHIPSNSWIFVSGTGWRSERLGFEKTISNPASFNPSNVRKK